MKKRQTMNKTHAKYEAACGLVNVVELLDPHLKGKVAVDGDPFPCPLPIHPKGSRHQVRIYSGTKFDKPRWKCGAGCHGRHPEDTLKWLQLRLQIDYREALTLWADLATSPREQWVGIVEQLRPNFFNRIGEARYIEEPVTDAEAEELQQKHLADGEATYFIETKLNKAFRSYRDAFDLADQLPQEQKVVLFEALRNSLEGNDAA